MVEWYVLLAFVPAALALNLTPGADMMFCLGQGLRSGKIPAIAASAGISLGGMVHVALAGLGLSAVIAAFPLALDVIRWIGAGYLLWLAWQALQGTHARRDGTKLTAGRAFMQGFVVNMTNPKVILFVLAFVPQFVDPARGSVLAQFLIFGSVLGVGGFVINGAVGVLAGGVGGTLTRNGAVGRILGYISAAVFVSLAARLLLVQKG